MIDRNLMIIPCILILLLGTVGCEKAEESEGNSGTIDFLVACGQATAGTEFGATIAAIKDNFEGETCDELKNAILASESISFPNQNIINISMFAEFTHLTSVNFSGNAIYDIRALGAMKKLTLLNLGSNLIADISYIAELTELETLQLDDNGITETQTLLAMSKLQYLDLSSNTKLGDISVVSTMPELTFLNIKNTSIENVLAVRDLENLVNFDFSDTPLTTGQVTKTEDNCPKDTAKSQIVKTRCTIAVVTTQ